ncbi:MAG: PQQ-dependent sugar dehydrogenase, partial [Anaerolineales bacterium]|nr:PQQ-dependent sugar dehydrogenase [Anaerolineales bacterium]
MLLRTVWPRLCLSLAVLLVTLGGSAPAAVSAQAGAQTVPAGFTDNLLADNIGGPTALAFTPDNRLLVTTQSGALRVYTLAGAALGTALTFASSQICSNFERGLLGLAVDPDFAVNNYIYLYYTYRNGAAQCSGSTQPVNRVARFQMSGNTVLTATQTVLVDNIPSLNGNHNGGDLNFGQDGYLYISVGDSGTGGSLARQRNTLAGKILRVNADGTPVSGNPWYGEAGARRCGDPAG